MEFIGCTKLSLDPSLFYFADLPNHFPRLREVILEFGVEIKHGRAGWIDPRGCDNGLPHDSRTKSSC